MKGDNLPCEDCDNAVYGFNEYEPRGGFIRCACPLKDERGRCHCDEAKRIIEKIGGA